MDDIASLITNIIVAMEIIGVLTIAGVIAMIIWLVKKGREE